MCLSQVVLMLWVTCGMYHCLFASTVLLSKYLMLIRSYFLQFALLLLWTLQLSPALRNRFTEIWCPLTFDKNDLVDIIAHNFVKGVAAHGWFQQCSVELPRVLGTSMIAFTDWFQEKDFGRRWDVTICTPSLLVVFCVPGCIFFFSNDMIASSSILFLLLFTIT